MPQQDDKSTAATLAIGGGLGAAPFLGLAGEQAITKDPYYAQKVKRLTPRELERMARVGDVILASQRRGSSVYKSPQLYTTGSEFYHAEPIIARSRGLGRASTAGVLEEFGAAKMTPEQILKGGVKSYSNPIPFGEYEDIVLMRPKTRLTKAQTKQFQRALFSRGSSAYSKPLGVRALFRDLFVPKIQGVTGRVGPQGPAVTCQGNMCSSLPATAWKDVFKQQVARGKHPKHTLPADFLRKGSPFEPVAASLENPEVLKRVMAKRMAFRGALGAGMGAAGMAAYHEPEILPGIAAAAGTTIGARSLLDYLHKQKPPRAKDSRLRALIKSLKTKHPGEHTLPGVLPTSIKLPELIQSLKGKAPMSKALKGRFARFGTRTLPLALGSGLAAYLGTKALTD